MAEVGVQNVFKVFESGKPVLQDISFTVKDAEFVTLLGPSGCGKTTLLRIIAGLESATSGEIHIGGREVSGVSPKDRDIAMVFQNYALYPHLKVQENIGMALKLRKYPPGQIKERVQEAARMLGLETLLDRKPKALSGGQRQRVALARAVVRHPKVFMLDEPLSNLDAVLREKTRGELKLLFRKVGGTVIYVTHDQVEAMTLSDRVVLLKDGLIQQLGSPEEIYSRPANTFVASFVGAPPMNIFPLSEAGELNLEIPDPSLKDRDALCGIRPEDILVSGKSRDGFSRGTVTLAEPTGAQTILSVKVGDAALRVALNGAFDVHRTEAWISCPREKLHFFDPVDGRSTR